MVIEHPTTRIVYIMVIHLHRIPPMLIRRILHPTLLILHSTLHTRDTTMSIGITRNPVLRPLIIISNTLPLLRTRILYRLILHMGALPLPLIHSMLHHITILIRRRSLPNSLPLTLRKRTRLIIQHTQVCFYVNPT